MEKALSKLPAAAMINILILISSIMVLPGGTNSEQLSRIFSKKELGLKREKLSHLHFYFHDIVGGKNPTAYRITQTIITDHSSPNFATVTMMDDPLTEGPDLSSKILGRSQGIYASASLNDLSYMMVLNFVFVEGKFNGSSLSLLRRNSVASTLREMPIVGGSGLFRSARGYAEARTHSFTFTKSGYSNAVVEYDVFVFH